MSEEYRGSELEQAHRRIAELERALKRIIAASCDVERDSALVHARHVLNGQ